MARSTLEDVSEQTFTAETIKKMYRLVDQAVTDPAFQKIVYDIVNKAMPGQWKNYRGELQALFNWYKKNIDYRRDPHGVELLQDVWATLDRKRGDCDDATVWLAAGATILGCPTRIVTVSTRPDKEPVHVYPEALVGGKWLAMDATVRGSTIGWAPPHITDKKVWTRSELGLGGDEDFSSIEGLGMIGNGRYGNDNDFQGTMTPVSGRLAPGVPDDISKTFAPGIPGTTNVTGRKIWRAPVASSSEWTSDPRPGGGVYGPALPVKPQPTPSDLWYLVDRELVPKVLDPNSAWWGKVPTSREDFNRMFPGSEGTMERYLRDIASVPESTIAEVTSDVARQVNVGAIGLGDIPAAIEKSLSRHSSVKPAPTVRGGVRNPYPAQPVDRRYLVPGPRVLIPRIPRLKGLGNMGDTVTDIAAGINAAVSSGALPADAASISKAINAAVGTPAPASTLSTVAQSAIPMGMIALLGGVAYMMSRKSGRSYRSNPRRSGRGRGRGRGPNKALLIGGGLAAAYFLLLRPGAPLAPAIPASTAPAGSFAAQQAALAAGVKAAGSLISSIFGGGSSTPAPAPAPSGMITSYDQLVPPTPSPSSSEMVTSYDQLTT